MHDLYSVTTPSISTINYCAAQMKRNFKFEHIWNEPCVCPRHVLHAFCGKKDMAVNWVFLQLYRKVLCMNGWMHLMSITDVSHEFWMHLECFLDICECYLWPELYCILPLVEKEIHIATGVIETIMTALLELASQSFFKNIYTVVTLKACFVAT